MPVLLRRGVLSNIFSIIVFMRAVAHKVSVLWYGRRMVEHEIYSLKFHNWLSTQLWRTNTSSGISLQSITQI